MRILETRKFKPINVIPNDILRVIWVDGNKIIFNAIFKITEKQIVDTTLRFSDGDSQCMGLETNCGFILEI